MTQAPRKGADADDRTHDYHLDQGQTHLPAEASSQAEQCASMVRKQSKGMPRAGRPGKPCRHFERRLRSMRDNRMRVTLSHELIVTDGR